VTAVKYRLVIAGTAALAAFGLLTGPASAQPGTPLRGPSTVTLVTGDQVTVNGSTQSIRAAGRGSAFMSFTGSNGDRYVIPGIAEPYLGRQLDPSLFDVTALARNGNANPANTTLGATLRRTIGADIAAGRPAGSTPLPADVVPAHPATPPTVTPHFPLHILQIDGIDANGQPAAALPVFLANTDSMNEENTELPLIDGVARIAVPAGDYTAVAFDPQFDNTGSITSARQVVLNDFVVAATGTTTVTLDERTATSRVTVATPRPATQDLAVDEFVRTDATGASTSSFSFDVNGAGPLLYNPQPPAKVGTFYYLTQWGGQPTTQPADPYRFDVAFPLGNVIPATASFTVRPDQLAVVHQHFSGDPGRLDPTGELLLGPNDPGLAAGFFTSISPTFEPFPEDMTEYLGTADGGEWIQSTAVTNATAMSADQRTFRAGHRYSIDWLHGPLGAGFGEHAGPSFCIVCTSGGQLGFAFNAMTDSAPDHIGDTFLAQTHFTLAVNGTTVTDQGTGVTGVGGVPLPGPVTIEATFDNDVTGVAGFSQSTLTHTDATVQYRPGADPTLPARDGCGGPTPTTPCAILPVLNLTYDLATDGNNTSHSPVQFLGLRVGHATVDGIGSHAPITHVTVAVSFDGGTTWTPANVLGSNGFYVATWRNEAGGPMLRVTAADAGGDAISQTITNAYTIATP